MEFFVAKVSNKSVSRFVWKWKSILIVWQENVSTACSFFVCTKCLLIERISYNHRTKWKPSIFIRMYYFLHHPLEPSPAAICRMNRIIFFCMHRGKVQTFFSLQYFYSRDFLNYGGSAVNSRLHSIKVLIDYDYCFPIMSIRKKNV